MRRSILIFCLLGLTLNLSATPTTITYQGQLQHSAGLFSGEADMQFQLYDSRIDGQTVGSPLFLSDVEVNEGLFSVDLDFGEVFDGSVLYLAVEVDGQPLTPRQRIAAVPLAQFALTPAGPEGPEGASPFELIGSDAVYLQGNVGVGKSPDFALDVDGTIGGTRVEVDEDLAFFDGTPQRTAGPIAKGYINSDGSIANSVNIESVEWEAGTERYRVTVAGENYWFNRYVTTITTSGSTPTAVSTSSQGGDLIVLFDGGAQRNFQLVVHDLPTGTVTQEALADSSALEVAEPRGHGTDHNDDSSAANRAASATGTLAEVRTENQALRKEVSDLESRLETLEQLLIGSEQLAGKD